MKPKKLIKFLRCELTQEEMRQAALSLARANEAMAAIEEEKKVATSQFAERIAQAKAGIGKFSRIISNGYEMRNVECEVRYHSGAQENAPGWKHIMDFPQQKVIIRSDVPPVPDGDSRVYPAAAIVAVEAMTEAELQEQFDFDQKQAAGEQKPQDATALPLCAKCEKEPVGTPGGVCDSCQADDKVNGKRGKKTGKGPRDSADRVGKVVSTPADNQPEEAF